MGLESGTYVSDLVATNPVANDPKAQGDDHLRLIKGVLQNTFLTADHGIPLERPQADVASAATCNIGAATSNFVRVTGVVTITAFDTVAAGIWRFIRFAGALTLTHSASLLLPGAANIVTVANDCALAVSLGTGSWIVLAYQRATNLNGAASEVGFTPVGGIAATNVQSAVAEVDSEAAKKAANLSDLANAATAFGNIKQTGTTTATGVLELATDAEVVTGTDTARVPPVSALARHEGVVKAWGAVTGSTGAVQDSFGVTSVTRTGTGRYTVNLSVTMANALYAVVLGNMSPDSDSIIQATSAGRTTTSFTIQTNDIDADGAGQPEDRDFAFAVYGTLA